MLHVNAGVGYREREEGIDTVRPEQSAGYVLVARSSKKSINSEVYGQFFSFHHQVHTLNFL